MNKQRKNSIKNCISELELIKNKLSKLLNEEQDYYDNMPENLQCSRRADDSEEAIDTLNEIIDNLNEAIGGINNI